MKTTLALLLGLVALASCVGKLAVVMLTRVVQTFSTVTDSSVTNSIWSVGDGSTRTPTPPACKQFHRRPLTHSSSMSNDSYYYLEMSKLETAAGMYDDGIYYFFGDSKPQHVTFKLKTDNPQI